MKEQDIQAGNKLIAEFERKGMVHPTDLKYHTSWDWLMLVVEKIEKIKGVHCVISELGCDIYHFGHHISNCREETKILTVYEAVIQFIQWYNQQKLENKK